MQEIVIPVKMFIVIGIEVLFVDVVDFLFGFQNGIVIVKNELVNVGEI